MCTALVWEEGAQSGYPAARGKVDTERECDDFFIEWVPGFSARDHREMLDRQRLLAREDDRDAAMLARADRLDAAQREWQEKQEREAERRHQEQTDAADKRHKGELEAARGRQVAETRTTTGLHEEDMPSAAGRHRTELWVFGGVIAVATIAAALIEVFFRGGGDVTVNLR